LWGALYAAACSDATGVRAVTGPGGEQFNTLVSATHAPVGGSMVVYDIAACAWVGGKTPDGPGFGPICGPSVTFTVTP